MTKFDFVFPVDEDDALVAADACDDVYSATKFLRQECELCASTMNVKEIVTMLGDCGHKCCLDCARQHFTIIIKDKSIQEAVCPFCQVRPLNSIFQFSLLQKENHLPEGQNQ